MNSLNYGLSLCNIEPSICMNTAFHIHPEVINGRVAKEPGCLSIDIIRPHASGITDFRYICEGYDITALSFSVGSVKKYRNGCIIFVAQPPTVEQSTVIAAFCWMITSFIGSGKVMESSSRSMEGNFARLSCTLVNNDRSANSIAGSQLFRFAAQAIEPHKCAHRFKPLPRNLSSLPGL